MTATQLFVIPRVNALRAAALRALAAIDRNVVDQILGARVGAAIIVERHVPL
jgi:hypothetical protein